MGTYGPVTNPLIYLAQDGPNSQPSVCICVEQNGTFRVIAYNGNELYYTEQHSSDVDKNAITAKLANIYDLGTFDSVYWDGEDGSTLERNFIIIE